MISESIKLIGLIVSPKNNRRKILIDDPENQLNLFVSLKKPTYCNWTDYNGILKENLGSKCRCGVDHKIFKYDIKRIS